MKLETERLQLREMTKDDAPFIFQLLNDEGWLRYIGDRKIHNENDAIGYIMKGPVSSYQRNGFGLLMVERKQDGARTGICGLIQRETLPHPDLGFAFLPQFRGKGYAFEAAAAVLAYAKDNLKLPAVCAIVMQENAPSIRVLEKLGLKLERKIPPAGADPELLLYS